MSPNPNDVDSIKLRIAELQLEHRGLNQMIERMGQECQPPVCVVGEARTAADEPPY